MSSPVMKDVEKNNFKYSCYAQQIYAAMHLSRNKALQMMCELIGPWEI